MNKFLTFILIFTTALFGDEFDLNPNNGAIENFKTLNLSNKFEINLKNNTPVTGLDYDEKSDTFLVGTLKFELYTMDSNLQNVKTYLKSTPDWIIQMEDTVSASFLNDSVGIMSYNKTYEFFKYNPNQTKEEANDAWRYLYDGYDKFSLDFKDRYYTIRAKQQYILSWDHSDFYNEFFVATVPDDIKNSWSIATFSDEDNMLSSEFIPKISENLTVKQDRNLDDYYITGMDANKDFVYLLSKQYLSILKLDPKSKEIVEVYVLNGLSDPRALAIKNNKFYVASREDGKNIIAIFE